MSELTLTLPDKSTITAEKGTTLSEVTAAQDSRFSTGISELDRTLGGGVVMGSVVLIGGDPGIGIQAAVGNRNCH